MDMDLVQQQVLDGHDDRVWSVSWSPSGNLLASCSGDKTVRVWASPMTSPSSVSSDWSSPACKLYCKAVLEETHSRTVRSCEWSPDGSFLATASFDSTTAIWEYAHGEFECLATLEGHETEVKSVAWNCDGTLLATCSRDKSVWIWEVPGGGVTGGGGASDFECIAVLHGHSQDVKMVRWHPHHNWLVSASYDDSIKVWVEDPDGNDWACAQTLDRLSGGHNSTVWAVAFDPSGSRMVSCSDDLTVKLWDTSSEPRGPADGAPSLELDAGASSMGSGQEGGGSHSDFTRSHSGWRHLSTISGHHRRSVFSVDWSRGKGGGLIATGAGDDAIRIFSPVSRDGSAGAHASVEADEASAMTVETEGAAVAEGRRGPQSLDLRAVRQKAHTTDVNCVRWHPLDGSILASAGDDETVRIWRLQQA